MSGAFKLLLFTIFQKKKVVREILRNSGVCKLSAHEVTQWWLHLQYYECYKQGGDTVCISLKSYRLSPQVAQKRTKMEIKGGGVREGGGFPFRAPGGSLLLPDHSRKVLFVEMLTVDKQSKQNHEST